MSIKLPIHQVIPELRSRLITGSAVILTAPPGSGKTTVTPIALLNEPWLAGSTILMLQPRRLAARLAATFMARQLGEEVGRTVGYRVRFDSRVSAATRVEVVTEGVFTRRLQNDPELRGVGLVIFDEFHERSLQADLGLTLCLDVMTALREDLKILVMSATLDTAALSALLDRAPVVRAAGVQHPVEVAYRPVSQRAGGATLVSCQAREIAGHTATAVGQVLAEQPGDLLAFLPGTAEIRHCQQLLAQRLAAAAAVIHPLYGDLSLSAQTAAVQPDPGGRRRVILATSIAETSITIEGVHCVVDSGWQRRPRFDPNSGLNRLVTQRISQASATQRAGRAGRLGPGYCLRLWSPHEDRGLRPFDPPEILSADLSPLLLELACWGITDPAALRWPNPPPPANLNQATELLQALGLLDSQGMVTELGRRSQELPVHPRLGLMLLQAPAGLRGLACDLAALLGERDISKGRERSVDIEERLQLLTLLRRDGAAAVRARAADPEACRRVLRVGRQLREQLAAPDPAPKDQPVWPGVAGELLAVAFPDRIGQRRPGRRGQYKLSSGRGAALAGHDPLAAQDYLVVPELDAGRSEGRIFLAAALGEDQLRSIFAHRLRQREEVFWDRQAGTVRARRQLTLAELVLEEAHLIDPDPEQVTQTLLAAIREQGPELLPWNDQARELQARIAAVGCWQPEAGWPEVDDNYLHGHPEQWLTPWLEGISGSDRLRRLNLAEILAARLSWSQRDYLAREVPTHLTVPSGSRRKLSYRPGEPPVLAVRLQELFGLADTPRIIENRVPVLLHLLSPAGRPVQITSDLRGFWENAYQEVKKELKGRYPKHHWPEDPWQAQPTARVKPRRHN
ncbi:ATP-dependent helicase HrpB [Desulfurivibrio sp. D14AmB]|uniref:ATP-dependent helicase HrpB n=1 Tax=Desulfurivibrio sp. D14AmB TaxID=3374370 RepID=UPI00376EF737